MMVGHTRKTFRHKLEMITYGGLLSSSKLADSLIQCAEAESSTCMSYDVAEN
jgi:hypothetical protein